MSDLETKARERLAELKQEIEMIESYLRLSDQTKALLNHITRTHVPPMTPSAHALRPPPAFYSGEIEAESPRKTRATGNPRPAVLIPAVIEILQTKGYPMSRTQIHKALEERGLIVRGVEPTKTLGTILWRARDQIDSIEGRGYWPKGDPVPEVGLDELLG